jgi:hypothetical protein
MWPVIAPFIDLYRSDSGYLYFSITVAVDVRSR